MSNLHNLCEKILKEEERIIKKGLAYYQYYDATPATLARIIFLFEKELQYVKRVRENPYETTIEDSINKTILRAEEMAKEV